MTIRQTIGAVVMAAVAAVGYGDDAVCDGAEREVDGTGEIAQCALNLSEVWTVTSFEPMDVPYSAVGWDVEESGASGLSVTLGLTPAEGGVLSVVASGLTGRGTNSWDTSGVRNGAYLLRHFLNTEEPIETLEAYLVFDRSTVRPLETLAEVAEAAFPDDGRPCAVTAMGGASWMAVGFAGDGIAGPATGTSTLTFALDGIGSFAFEYLCAAGETLTVTVDGGEPQTLAAVADWTAARFALGDVRAHTVVFTATGGGTAVRNVRWVDVDDRFGGGQGGAGAADLREGVLIVRRANELMPFAWSSTNFTGNALVKDTGFVAIDPQSVASVRVVQVTGAGDDVSQWTTEVAGTAKTLVAEKQGEGAVKWKHVQRGVWKAELIIVPPAGEAYRETRILDLRKYVGQGMLFFLK